MCQNNDNDSHEQIRLLQQQRKTIVGYSVKVFRNNHWGSFIVEDNPWKIGEITSEARDGFHFFQKFEDALKFLRNNEWGERIYGGKTLEHQGLFMLIINTEDLLELGTDDGFLPGAKVGTAKKVYWDGTILEERNKPE